MRVLIFLLLFCGVAQAAQVTDLYLGKVEVASRDNADRRTGSRDALAQVLIRVTGNPAVAQSPEGRSILGQVDQAVLSFGYEGDNPLLLVVRFDETRIQGQLRAANLPIWGAQRPNTLVWLATESEAERTIVTDDSPVAAPLNDLARARGLPLVLPLMDLEDSMVVSLDDVWGNFPGPVGEASGRYDMDFYLSAVVNRERPLDPEPSSLVSDTPQEGSWRYQLNLYSPKQPGDFGVQRSLLRREGLAASQEAALEGLMGELSLYYASRYAALASAFDDGRTTLTVTLGGGIKELVSLERYLLSLAPVEGLTIRRVRDRELLLELDLIGSMDEVEQLLTLEPRMTRTAPGGAEPAEEQDPYATPPRGMDQGGQNLREPTRYHWQDR